MREVALEMFTLKPGHWYSAYFVPGHSASSAGFEYFMPFCTPIRIEEFRPLRSGSNLAAVRYVDLSSSDAGETRAEWQIVLRIDSNAVGLLRSGTDAPQVSVTAGEISHLWLERYCSHMAINCTDRSGNDKPEVETYLNELLAMRRGGTVYDLFPEDLGQWGLRGDPYLWSEMRRQFFTVKLPESESALKALVVGKFQELVGASMDGNDHVHVERFAHGGMSSGGISREFWRDRAVPLICEAWRNAT